MATKDQIEDGIVKGATGYLGKGAMVVTVFVIIIIALIVGYKTFGTEFSSAIKFRQTVETLEKDMGTLKEWRIKIDEAEAKETTATTKLDLALDDIVDRLNSTDKQFKENDVIINSNSEEVARLSNQEEKSSGRLDRAEEKIKFLSQAGRDQKERALGREADRRVRIEEIRVLKEQVKEISEIMKKAKDSELKEYRARSVKLEADILELKLKMQLPDRNKK